MLGQMCSLSLCYTKQRKINETIYVWKRIIPRRAFSIPSHDKLPFLNLNESIRGDVIYQWLRGAKFTVEYFLMQKTKILFKIFEIYTNI